VLTRPLLDPVVYFIYTEYLLIAEYETSDSWNKLWNCNCADLYLEFAVFLLN